VRHWSGIALIVALATIAPQTILAILSGAVSVSLEALPYLTAAAFLTPLAGRYARSVIAYAGCGCGLGSNARSVPAAFVTALLFGPFVALARVATASLTSRMFRPRDHAETTVLGELADLVPTALLAATLTLWMPAVPLYEVHPVLLWLGGAVLGVVASPCALGGVALAASLRASAPFAAAGVLCTAGIFPSAFRSHTHRGTHDPLAYLLLAVTCGLVAVHRGATLVHPRMTIPLVVSGVYCAILAWRFREHASRVPRLIAGAVLAVLIIGAPAPAYRATETTLADAFPGEHVDFTGVAVQARGRSALVRYAITCCRADAAPVALALDRSVVRFGGTWMRARGTIEDHDGALWLRVAELTPVTPPLDPFVYR